MNLNPLGSLSTEQLKISTKFWRKFLTPHLKWKGKYFKNSKNLSACTLNALVFLKCSSQIVRINIPLILETWHWMENQPQRFRKLIALQWSTSCFFGVISYLSSFIKVRNFDYSAGGQNSCSLQLNEFMRSQI